MNDVDCMACLVNLARGLGVDPYVSVEASRIGHNGITHVAIYEMGPGVIRAACRYKYVYAWGKHWMWVVPKQS